jgi:hypothetical protein
MIKTTKINPKSVTVCASRYGIFVVQPHKGSVMPAGSKYVVMWNGGISKARCTCSGWNFTLRPKRCKHLIWVEERACFLSGGPVPTPTHSERKQRKQGGVKDPHAFGFPMDLHVSKQPTLTAGVCRNCEGPLMIVRSLNVLRA